MEQSFKECGFDGPEHRIFSEKDIKTRSEKNESEKLDQHEQV